VYNIVIEHCIMLFISKSEEKTTKSLNAHSNHVLDFWSFETRYNDRYWGCNTCLTFFFRRKIIKPLVGKTSKSTYARKTQNIGMVSKRFVYVLVSYNTEFVLYTFIQIYTDHDRPRVIFDNYIGVTSIIIFQTALPSIGIE